MFIARFTDVQATLHTVRVTLPTTTRTRLARIPLALSVNEDTVLLSLVLKQRGETVELPPVEFLIEITRRKLTALALSFTHRC